MEQCQRPQPYRFVSADSVYQPLDSITQPNVEISTTETEIQQPLQARSRELEWESASFELNNPHDLDEAYSAERARSKLLRDTHHSRHHWKYVKEYLPRTRWMVTFLIVVMLQTLICICLTASVIRAANNYLSDPASGGIQATILLVEVLYQLFLTLDAGRRKNMVQIIGICLNNVSMLLMVALTYLTLVKASGDPIEEEAVREYMALIALLGTCSLIMLTAAWLGFREFEWFVRTLTHSLVLFG